MNKLLARVTAGVLAGFVLVSFLACGNVQQAAQKQKRANTLKQIGIMYHDFNDMTGKGPTGPQDFQQFASQSPDGVAAIQSGQVVFIYGVKLTEMLQGTANTVIGYEADVPKSGGYVLFGDGAVRQMTVQEFNAATKAQPKGN